MPSTLVLRNPENIRAGRSASGDYLKKEIRQLEWAIKSRKTDNGDETDKAIQQYSQEIRLLQNAIPALEKLPPKAMPEERKLGIVLDPPCVITVGRLREWLQSEDTITRRNAASRIFSVAQDAENERHIFEGELVEPLLKLFDDNSEDVRVNATAAMFQLSQRSENRSRLVHQNVIQPLLALLERENGRGDDSTNAAGIVMLLCEVEEIGRSLVEKGIVPLLGKLMEHGSPTGRENAAGAVCLLSRYYEKAVLVGMGIYPLLVEVLEVGDAEEKKAAALLIGLMAEGEASIAGEREISLLVKLVGTGPSASRQNAVGAIQAFSRTPQNRNLLHSAGALPLLSKVLDNGSYGEQVNAAMAIAHISVDFSVDPIFVVSHVIPVLLLDISNKASRIALLSLSSTTAGAKELRDTDADKNVFKHFKENKNDELSAQILKNLGVKLAPAGEEDKEKSQPSMAEHESATRSISSLVIGSKEQNEKASSTGSSSDEELTEDLGKLKIRIGKLLSKVWRRPSRYVRLYEREITLRILETMDVVGEKFSGFVSFPLDKIKSGMAEEGYFSSLFCRIVSQALENTLNLVKEVAASSKGDLDILETIELLLEDVRKISSEQKKKIVEARENRSPFEKMFFNPNFTMNEKIRVAFLNCETVRLFQPDLCGQKFIVSVNGTKDQFLLQLQQQLGQSEFSLLKAHLEVHEEVDVVLYPPEAFFNSVGAPLTKKPEEIILAFDNRLGNGDVIGTLAGFCALRRRESNDSDDEDEGESDSGDEQGGCAIFAVTAKHVAHDLPGTDTLHIRDGSLRYKCHLDASDGFDVSVFELKFDSAVTISNGSEFKDPLAYNAWIPSRSSQSSDSRLDIRNVRLSDNITVYKIGAATGFTSGTFYGFGVVSSGAKGFNGNQECVIVRWPSETEPFARNGDSGSLYFINKKGCVPLAIHCGSGYFVKDGQKIFVSFGCPVWLPFFAHQDNPSLQLSFSIESCGRINAFVPCYTSLELNELEIKERR